MQHTNRRIDFDVEELTRRISFESKPFLERIFININRMRIKWQPEIDLIFSTIVVIGYLFGFYYLLKHLISIF